LARLLLVVDVGKRTRVAWEPFPLDLEPSSLFVDNCLRVPGLRYYARPDERLTKETRLVR